MAMEMPRQMSEPYWSNEEHGLSIYHGDAIGLDNW